MKSEHHGADAQVFVYDPHEVLRALKSHEPILLAHEPTDAKDLLELADRLRARLRSTGGRPSDPSWDTTRRIPFRSDVWQHVQEAANRVSAVTGHKISPAQLCSQILEDRISDLDDAALRAFEEKSNPSE